MIRNRSTIIGVYAHYHETPMQAINQCGVVLQISTTDLPSVQTTD